MKLVTIKGYKYIRFGSRKYLVTYNGKRYKRFVYIFKGDYMAIINGQWFQKIYRATIRKEKIKWVLNH